MNLHQVLTGAVNPGDNCFSVGSLHDQPFTVSPPPGPGRLRRARTPSAALPGARAGAESGCVRRGGSGGGRSRPLERGGSAPRASPAGSGTARRRGRASPKGLRHTCPGPGPGEAAKLSPSGGGSRARRWVQRRGWAGRAALPAAQGWRGRGASAAPGGGRGRDARAAPGGAGGVAKAGTWWL